jgi:transglutaminase-like putative cysteine protease
MLTAGTLAIDVGCTFAYEVSVPTPAVFMVRPIGSQDQRIVDEHWNAAPVAPYRDYVDLYGNVCRRATLPAGKSTLRYDARVEVPDALDAIDRAAAQYPVDQLPDEALVYTLPSRYCLSDVLGDEAWRLFGSTPPNYERVQAICDHVNGSTRFAYGTSLPTTTAADVLANGVGVCRDFAHLAITFARALNVPARYVFGYLPDIDVGPVDAPMDFCAWFEAYLGGRWWTFDPRNNQRRRGRVVIARGRDALDVAMVTTYGGAILHDMAVRADRSV